MDEPIAHPKRSLWAFLPVIAALGVTLAAVIVLVRAPERAYVTNDVAGRPAPAYSMPSLDGAGVVSPEAFAGRPYLINAFASWCVPCRAEHPLLVELAAEGVPILGLAYKDEADNTRAFLAELGDPYTAVGLDPEGRVHMDLGASGVPETFVVGADGRLLAVVREPLTRERIDQVIRPALQAEPDDPN
jgi:cytochrome c biogenesis protein CcmG/thiol:disulfide interchange protein DsbE